MAGRAVNLRELFVGLTLASFLAWATSAPSALSCIAGLIAWSAIGAAWGRLRFDDPIAYGAAAGALAVVVFIVCYWPIYGYHFYHSVLSPDVPDGLPLRVMVFPFLGILCYAPFGAILGVAVGLVVWWISDHFVRPARSERPSVPESPLG